MVKSTSARGLLLALVLGTALPLFMLSIVMFLQMVSTGREQAREALMNSVRSLAALVDHEIDTHRAVAAAIVGSQALQSGDLASYRAQAKQAVEILAGTWIVLADPKGQIVASTKVETSGAKVPPEFSDLAAKAFTSGHAQVSDLLPEGLHDRWHAVLVYPVIYSGVPLYAVIVGLEPDRFLHLLQGKISGASAVGIVDRNRKFIARIPNHEMRVGELAAPGWIAALARSSTGFHDSSTIEGEPSLQAYTVAVDGWSVGIAVSIAVLDAPLHRIWWWTGSIALLLSACSLAVGFGIGQRLRTTLMELASTATKVGHGEIVECKGFGIDEATSISKALAAASVELARRSQALGESEARFRATFENTAVGVAHISLEGRFVEANSRLCEILGYPREELQSLTFQQLTHPDDLGDDLENQSRLRSGQVQSYTMDKRYIRKDGQPIWMGLTVSLRRDGAGAPLYFIKIVQDVTARKEAQSHQRFLLRELLHRSKNQLAIVQAMFRQTSRGAASIEEVQQAFSQRLEALSVSTSLLVEQDWKGAPLEHLIRRHLAAFTIGEARLACEGPEVTVSPEAAEAIGLTLHELATNAVKYGAWSVGSGCVSVSWCTQRRPNGDEELRLSWIESGGPTVEPPKRRGFGELVVKQMVAQKVGGEVEMSYAPEGVIWVLHMPGQHFEGGQTSNGRFQFG